MTLESRISPKLKHLWNKVCPSVPSECSLIIGITFLSVICLTITLQKELFNSSLSKYQTKAMLINYITKLVINTLKRNVKQVRQIEDSLFSFENKIGRQSLEDITLNLPIQLSYPLIDKLWDIFRVDASTKKLNMCKNVDDYENMMRSFYAWLTFFVWSLHYYKCKTVFYSTLPDFYHVMDKNKKIGLFALFKNVYN